MSEWIDIASKTEIKDGELSRFESGGHAVVLIGHKGNYFAIANNCPHMRAPMSMGQASKTVVKCPLHMATFDFTTGKRLTEPMMGGAMPGMETLPEATLQAFAYMGEVMTKIDCGNLTTYETKVEGERVHVKVA